MYYVNKRNNILPRTFGWKVIVKSFTFNSIPSTAFSILMELIDRLPADHFGLKSLCPYPFLLNWATLKNHCSLSRPNSQVSPLSVYHKG